MKVTKLTCKLKIPLSSTSIHFGLLNTLIISHNLIDVGSNVFILSILRYNQIGDHVKDDLTNFGYRLDMKLKILKIFLYFGNLLKPFVKNWWLFICFKFKGIIRANFLTIILCMCQNDLFGLKCKKWPKENKMVGSAQYLPFC